MIMKKLVEKLNYKGQDRIAIINAEESFYFIISDELRDVKIDREIDPRFPYDFIILFVKSIGEVEYLTPIAMHNLLADGVLWFCFPKKSSKIYSSEIDRDHGWKTLNDSGFHGIRMVAIDDNWSALRFRNIKYIKSTSGRFNK
jgi:hypothetical protein